MTLHNGVNPFDFDRRDEMDVTPKEIRGIIWQKREYILKKCNERGNAAFTTAKIKAARMNDGKLVGISSGGELPSLLLSFCLFRITLRPDGTEALQPLTPQHIQDNWPPHYVQELFEQAKKISHIDQSPIKTRPARIKELREELLKLETEEAAEREALVEIGPDGDPLPRAIESTKDDIDEDPVGNSSNATRPSYA